MYIYVYIKSNIDFFQVLNGIFSHFSEIVEVIVKATSIQSSEIKVWTYNIL